MSTPTPSRIERRNLCELFLKIGPDAPTLCEGWTTTDLAAHLVIREHNLLSTPGIMLPGPFAALTERILVKTKSTHSYEELVATIGSGPPLLWRPMDAMVNLAEYFVHHEDVRRGDGNNTPRPLAAVKVVEDALWRMLTRGGKLLTRKFKGFGLDLVRDGGDTVHARTGDQVAILTGRPGELILYLMGRKTAAQVEFAGPDEALAALRATPFGA